MCEAYKRYLRVNKKRTGNCAWEAKGYCDGSRCFRDEVVKEGDWITEEDQRQELELLRIEYNKLYRN